MLQQAVDRCIQCGFCLQACPTYRMFEDEESSPRGRIALAKQMLRGDLQPSASALATFDECLGCRACEAACPSGVHYSEVFLHARAQLLPLRAPRPWSVRLLFALIRRPGALAWARRAWRPLGRWAILLARALRPQQPPLALLAALPAPTPQALSALEGRPAAAIHRGCLMNVFWEGTNARAALLLRAAGVPAALMDESVGCCGALHAHEGDLEAARAMARRVIEAFEAQGAGHIVSLAGGCGAFMKEYPDLFTQGDAYRTRAQALAQALTDVTSLLVAQGAMPNPGAGAASYQDSCHLRNGMGVTAPPRSLLEAAGEYRELGSAGQCCGSAGVYNLLRPDVAAPIIREKAAELKALGSQTLVTANPGCELQWRMGVRSAGVDAEVCHIVDHLFRRGIAEPARPEPAQDAGQAQQEHAQA